MKKLFVITALLLLGIFLFGCTGSGQQSTAQPTNQPTGTQQAQSTQQATASEQPATGEEINLEQLQFVTLADFTEVGFDTFRMSDGGSGTGNTDGVLNSRNYAYARGFIPMAGNQSPATVSYSVQIFNTDVGSTSSVVSLYLNDVLKKKGSLAVYVEKPIGDKTYITKEKLDSPQSTLILQKGKFFVSILVSKFPREDDVTKLEKLAEIIAERIDSKRGPKDPNKQSGIMISAADRETFLGMCIRGIEVDGRNLINGNCVEDLAVATDNVSICDEMKDKPSTMPWESCVKTFAVITKNPSLCELLKPGPEKESCLHPVGS